MKVLGITGPSGAGKTTITNILRNNYKAYTIDADEVAKRLSNNNQTEYFLQMVNLFGNDVVKEDGNLDRKKVASMIYNNEEKRNSLNKLTFQYVVDEITNQIEEERKQNYDYIGIDVPLLYEAKMEKLCDCVIAVVAEDDEKIARICKRDNISPQLAKQRLEIQNNNEFFVKKANFVIYNDGSMERLENSLKEIIEKIWKNGFLEL